MIFWISVTAMGSIPGKGFVEEDEQTETTTRARVISTRRRSPPDSV